MRMFVNSLLSIFTLCSDRTPKADAILKTTSLARRYGISSFATHGPLSATVFMVLYLKCFKPIPSTSAVKEEEEEKEEDDEEEEDEEEFECEKSESSNQDSDEEIDLK